MAQGSTRAFGVKSVGGQDPRGKGKALRGDGGNDLGDKPLGL